MQKLPPITHSAWIRLLIAPVLVVCAAILLIVPRVFAEETPEEMVKKLISEVKSSGSPMPILERVDWKTAFTQIAPKYKAGIGAKTPDELKKFYHAVFENPVVVMKEKLASKMGSLPPEQQAALEVLMMRAETTITDRKKTEMEKLRRSEFKVVGSKIEGDKATVDIESLLDGITKTQTLHLIKADGKWRFPSLQWVRAPDQVITPTN